MRTTTKNPPKNIKTINIKTNEENPQPVDLIAEEIIKVSGAIDKLNNSNLTKRAIVLLIFDLIPNAGYRRKNIGMKDIETILETIPKLKQYLKTVPEKKKK